MNKISELKDKQGDVNVEGVITEVSPAREFQKFGRPGKVANSVLKDDSGEIVLTLWNEDVENVKEGDRVRITNGFVKEWQGHLQLSTGRMGSLEKVEGESPAPADEDDAE